MSLDNLAAQGKTQSRTALTSGIRLLGRIERLKNVRQLVMGNSAAGITNHNFSPALGRVITHDELQASVLAHRLTSIDDQVHQQLLNLAGIRFSPDTLRRLQIHIDTMHLKVFLDQHQHIFQQLF